MEGDNYKAIVIGGSAGSIEILLPLFSFLPEELNLPIVVVTHLHPDDDGGLVGLFSRQFSHKVGEAMDKEQVQNGSIYFPAADYHLLVETDGTFSLSLDPKVNYSRPSIDVLFESAAQVWGDGLVGIILTGASSDGAEGIRAIKKYGGLTIAQDPDTATYPVMPQAAIDTGKIDKILAIDEIGHFLARITSHIGKKRTTETL